MAKDKSTNPAPGQAPRVSPAPTYTDGELIRAVDAIHGEGELKNHRVLAGEIVAENGKGQTVITSLETAAARIAEATPADPNHADA